MKITLRALRELVGSTKGKNLPTAKALRESDVEVVASASVGADGRLTVYRNGFYIYQTNIGATVHAVDRCAGYTYDNDDDSDACQLEDEAWELRLALEGEDRLEHNNNVREENHRLHYSGDTADHPDSHDFLSDLESRESLEQILGCLTDKQRQVVQMYYFNGLPQEEIQTRLHLSRGALLDRLNGAIYSNKLKSAV